jgi:hypothetical protein
MPLAIPDRLICIWKQNTLAIDPYLLEWLLSAFSFSVCDCNASPCGDLTFLKDITEVRINLSIIREKLSK